MENIIYKDNKVYNVFGMQVRDGNPWFLIHKAEGWCFVEALDCVPHYTSIPMYNV